jgi:hypothetical protein
MNPAHLHLMLNHLPLLTLPVIAVFLAHSLWLKNEVTGRFALILITLASLAVLAVDQTGERAEGQVEELAGINKSSIHEHEEAAEISVPLSLAVAGLAILTLLAGRGLVVPRRYERQLSLSVLLAALVATVSLGYTANLGGQIRHTEIHSPQNTGP